MGIIDGRHIFFSFATFIESQLEFASEYASSFAIDNGAFTTWRQGKKYDPVKFYCFVEKWIRKPAFDWALIPDVIDGSAKDNDDLLKEWPFSKTDGVPVWHIHESLSRLERLAREWPRIAIGSSGEYSVIGTDRWWHRMSDAFGKICVGGEPITRVHGLRMLNPKIFTKFPFESCDSCNVALHHCDSTRIYKPEDHKMNGLVMLHNIEKHQSASRFEMAQQGKLF
jgi:hypothetical protein